MGIPHAMKTSKTIFGNMFLFLLCSFSLCGFLGCGGWGLEGKDPNPPFRYISADLTILTEIYTGDYGDGRKAVVKIIDPAEVARLVKFFPGVGTKQNSKLDGLWEPELEVILTRVENGKNITVRVVAVDTNWSEGRGDFLVRGNLKEYLKNLVEGKTITANKVKH